MTNISFEQSTSFIVLASCNHEYGMKGRAIQIISDTVLHFPNSPSTPLTFKNNWFFNFKLWIFKCVGKKMSYKQNLAASNKTFSSKSTKIIVYMAKKAHVTLYWSSPLRVLVIIWMASTWHVSYIPGENKTNYTLGKIRGPKGGNQIFLDVVSYFLGHLYCYFLFIFLDNVVSMMLWGKSHQNILFNALKTPLFIQSDIIEYF